MFNRPLLFVGVLIAAIVVPYVVFDERLGETARAQLNRLRSFVPGANAAANAEPSPSNEAGGPALTPVTTTLPPTIDEAFNFEVTPQWVTSRWPKVTTVAGDPSQLGMRVPVVSGTQPDDIAGSLTYFFDEHHQLQRITFTGQTAEPRKLLAAIVPRYGLVSCPTTHAAHYIAGDSQNPTSQVIVRHLPVISNDAKAPRVEVAVDLRQADIVGWEKKAAQQPEPTIIPSSYRRW
jgi:hypothetical protein